ncbi:Outer membrane protein assembly factor BamD [Novipirellula galeiformis]|uniref:Outer membrane protein assembly factor BamD n=1 Tax=Novipirellula galeiformis TaxID=2528004 RepID=A0A5C6CQ67_9BACT|nr:tetratricopeptide repeat protein [Novipirellula galeiformis]TWU26632.1 Outer membrane protein assembly factor BamD [Novipirellula galeiformis]
MARSSKQRLIIAVILTALTVSVGNPLSAQSHGINEMSLERWAKLREVERHQLKIAEKYFLEKSWSVAADEYDKYLTLYESSDAASYVMLKWSLCQVEMRRQNTAIKDGFQSVIDYWPESDDAIAASYYKGKTLKDIGQNEKAKPALQQVLEDHPKHHVSVYAAVQLAEIAALEDNLGDKIKQWRHLTFDVIRDNATSRWCQEASQHLASHQLAHGEFDEAVKALETTYDAERLPLELVNRSQSVLETSMRESATASQGNRLADQLIQFLREQEPAELDDASAKSAATQLLYLIARVQRVVNRDEDVLKTFGEIANRFGADDELLSQTAEYYQAKQNFDKARQAFRNFKNQPDGLSRVARSYRQEKNPELAILTYAQLVSIDPEQTAVWKAEMAMTYREASKHAEAIKIYEALLNEDREHSDKWLWETAMTYRDASKWKEAIGFFRQSDQFPNNYREMAWCHRRLKQYGEAVILYNQIAGGHESSAPWAVLQIGYTEEEAGNQERAITAFKKVCKQFPKDRHASQAHAHLQNKYKLSVTLGGAKQD